MNFGLEKALSRNDNGHLLNFLLENNYITMEEAVTKVLELGKSNLIENFYLNVKNAPKTRIIEDLYDKKNSECLVNITKDIYDKYKKDKFLMSNEEENNIKSLITNNLKHIIEIGDPKWMYEIIFEIVSNNWLLIDDINKLKEDFYDAILNGMSPYEIYDYELNIGGNVLKSAKKICDIGTAEVIYNYACNIKDAPIEMLTDAICKSENMASKYYYARDVKGADIEKICQSVIDTNDLDQIIWFRDSLSTAPIDKMNAAIKKLELLEANKKNEAPANLEYMSKEEKFKYFTDLYTKGDIESLEIIKENEEIFRNLFKDDLVR